MCEIKNKMSRTKRARVFVCMFWRLSSGERGKAVACFSHKGWLVCRLSHFNKTRIIDNNWDIEMSSLGKRGTKQPTDQWSNRPPFMPPSPHSAKFNAMALNVCGAYEIMRSHRTKGLQTVAVEQRTILSQVVRRMEAAVRKQCDTHMHNKTIYADNHTRAHTNYSEKVFVCDKCVAGGDQTTSIQAHTHTHTHPMRMANVV